MDNVYDIVLSYGKVAQHLEKHPQDKDKVLKMIDEIRGDYNPNVLSAATRFIDKTFRKLYDDFNLEAPEGFSLSETLTKYHVVLCPNHQSHADYLALQYILYKKFKLPVYIAAGINLNIFPIGKIFQKCGAFFIRRKFTENVYKITFQGYIYYLLKTDKVVKFFFEGGRTRTGKLLPPKFGLFSMILDAHTRFDEGKKPLMFIPVSIAHEHIPEEGAHAKELGGGKKEKEKSTQLFKLFKLFNKKLGTVHVKFGEGTIVDEEFDDLKRKTQELAFETFKKVGRGMPITPSSLLSLILLDEPSGAQTWKQIEKSTNEIIDFCQYMNIPLTKSLHDDKAISSIRMAMDMFINNKKVEVIKKEKLNLIYYAIAPESRVHLLFHKNMILHHFLVPAIMSATWINMFNGSIKSNSDLAKFLIRKRRELKYEFYLPSNKEMVKEGIKIIEFAIGRKIDHVSESFELSKEELYQVALKIRRFSTALNHIYEAYYVAMITFKYLQESPFSLETYLQTSHELFLMEKEHGRIVKYEESYTVPSMKTALESLKHMNIMSQKGANLEVIDLSKLNNQIEKIVQDINDQVAINIKFSDHD